MGKNGYRIKAKFGLNSFQNGIFNLISGFAIVVLPLLMMILCVNENYTEIFPVFAFLFMIFGFNYYVRFHLNEEKREMINILKLICDECIV